MLIRVLLALALIGFGVVLFRTAWLCDDAYISYRTVSNFVEGHGLRWNVGERVQAYTHPLWLFLNIAVYAVTGEEFVSGIVLCMVVSLAAVALAATRLVRGALAGVLAVTLLACSRAFVDFSTSGLENSLTHLFLAVFLIPFFRDSWTPRTMFTLAIVASLGMLNRMDAVLLYLPALLYGWGRAPGARSALWGVLGFFPFLVWEGFSLVYYGFLLPNTAYAKLGTGTDRLRLVEQGLHYLQASLQRDAITVVVLVAAVLAVCWRRRAAEAVVTAGAVLYLIYVVAIGGDFMSGRYFSAPYFLAVVVFVRLAAERRAFVVASLPVAFALCLIQPHPPMFTGASYGLGESDAFGPHFIVDERRVWYRSMSLLRLVRGANMPDHDYADRGMSDRRRGRTFVARGSIGLHGYYAGPEVHIVDHYGLADPLLARLPAIHRVNFKVGHFDRRLPLGYITTLQTGHDEFADADLGRFYQKLRTITTGPLWSRERWTVIMEMQLGRFRHLIDEDAARFPLQRRVRAKDVAVPKSAGARWNAPGMLIFGDAGLHVTLGRLVHAERLVVSLDGNDEYRITLIRNGEKAHGIHVGSTRSGSGGLRVYSVDLPDRVAREGYTDVRIVPYRGDGRYSLGHLANRDPPGSPKL